MTPAGRGGLPGGSEGAAKNLEDTPKTSPIAKAVHARNTMPNPGELDRLRLTVIVIDFASKRSRLATGLFHRLQFHIGLKAKSLPERLWHSSRPDLPALSVIPFMVPYAIDNGKQPIHKPELRAVGRHLRAKRPRSQALRCNTGTNQARVGSGLQ